jgi:hypothetical protein
LQNSNIFEQAPNFIICSDAFTAAGLGWIEGSLLSSNAAVERLTGSAANMHFNETPTERHAQ